MPRDLDSDQMTPPPASAEPHAPAQEADELRRMADEDDLGLVMEFFCFLRDNKKWWLIPLVVSILLLGLLSIFAASGAAPFIYTVF